MKISRVDSNQKEIVTAFRKMGAVVILTHQIKNAFDCIVFYRSRIFVVEIKDGKKPASQRRLTPGEAKCKKEIEETGNQYHIIKSVSEAEQLLKTAR